MGQLNNYTILLSAAKLKLESYFNIGKLYIEWTMPAKEITTDF